MQWVNIKRNNLVGLVRSGDVILFSNNSKEKFTSKIRKSSFWIRLLTKSPWNHVAIVAREKDSLDNSHVIYEYASPGRKISKQSINVKLSDPTLTEVAVIRSQHFKNQSQSCNRISFDKLEENYKVREMSGDYSRRLALKSTSPMYLCSLMCFILMTEAAAGFIIFCLGGSFELFMKIFMASVLALMMLCLWLYVIYRNRNSTEKCCENIVTHTKALGVYSFNHNFDVHQKNNTINGNSGDFCSGYVYFAYGLLGGDVYGVKPFYTVPSPANLASHYLEKYDINYYRLN